MNIDSLRGQRGRIYVARKGTVTVIVLEGGDTYMTSNTTPTGWLVEHPVPAYWMPSIDWQGGFVDHMTLGIKYDTMDSAHYPPGEMIVPMTPDRVAKLDAITA